ncbi:hypothetical protein T11_10859 [Trichinella zimbabwensis]|uniref:Uncharacterized protein n=1 Tax=Trichinella zimbabwensis TaxID=268475 RepID=A0A0V1HU99_9BILA|nr:hypothetical protein T11_10859 [Trichinella zimbabwensis]
MSKNTCIHPSDKMHARSQFYWIYAYGSKLNRLLGYRTLKLPILHHMHFQPLATFQLLSQL